MFRGTDSAPRASAPVRQGVPPMIAGVILAGGRSRRLGGGDKCLLDLGGRPILGHVVDRFRPQVAALALNANGDAARFATFGLQVVPDDLPNFPGPLAGILAGLDWAAQAGFSALATVPADTPFLPRDLVARLDAARQERGADLACAASRGMRHPVCGLWTVELRRALRRALVEEDLREVGAWAARHGPALAEYPAEPFDPFFNINTPEDLAAAERALASWRGACG